MSDDDHDDHGDAQDIWQGFNIATADPARLVAMDMHNSYSC